MITDEMVQRGALRVQQLAPRGVILHSSEAQVIARDVLEAAELLLEAPTLCPAVVVETPEASERRRAWSVVAVDDRALTIRSYEDGDDLDAVFVVNDASPTAVEEER